MKKLIISESEKNNILNKYYTNVVFLVNYTNLLPFFSSITVISGIIPTLPEYA